MSDFRRHYAIFYRDSIGTPCWNRSMNRREATRYAKKRAGTVYMVNHGSDMAWDAPTFRSVGTCIADFRTEA